jgi:23S rRNA pseudouridine1911/1915/1917 synthase
MYGGRMRIPSKLDASLRETLRAFDRQALHAAELRLNHPVTGQEMGWQSPLPEDIRQLLASLREFETNDRR